MHVNVLLDLKIFAARDHLWGGPPGPRPTPTSARSCCGYSCPVGQTLPSANSTIIPIYEIPTALRQLLADTNAWIEYKAYPPDEIAVRFHHRLVQIHPFPNGNGRHARLMADLLIMRLGMERFSWGRENLRDAGTVRRRYIAALQTADNHDIGPLLAFARS